MPFSQKTIHKGFTLVELIIVIFIVSLVYYLGFSGVEIHKAQPKALTVLNLKSMIVNDKDYQGQASLLCTDKCRSCFLRQNITSPFKPYNNPIDLSHIKAYTVDNRDNLLELEYERYKDKRICLQMDFFPNGSSTQLILESDKGTYFLPAFFGEPKEFNSPEDAKDYWLESSNLVSDSGDYY